MADEQELVDPQETLRKECGEDSHCRHAKEELDQCTQRLNEHPETTETCSQELYDFLHCVDHCVAKSLLTKLK